MSANEPEIPTAEDMAEFEAMLTYTSTRDNLGDYIPWGWQPSREDIARAAGNTTYLQVLTDARAAGF